MLRQYVSYVSPWQIGFKFVLRYLRGTIPGLRPKGLEGLWRIQCVCLLMVNRSAKQGLRCFQLDGAHLLLMKCIRVPKMRNTQFHNLQPPNELNLPQDDVELVNIMRRFKRSWQEKKAVVPAVKKHLGVASVAYCQGDIKYITQGMVHMASESIGNDLATIQQISRRFGHQRLHTKACVRVLLNNKFSCPLFTDKWSWRSRSVPVARVRESGGSYGRRSRSTDELDTQVQ